MAANQAQAKEQEGLEAAGEMRIRGPAQRAALDMEKVVDGARVLAGHLE